MTDLLLALAAVAPLIAVMWWTMERQPKRARVTARKTVRRAPAATVRIRGRAEG